MYSKITTIVLTFVVVEVMLPPVAVGEGVVYARGFLPSAQDAIITHNAGGHDVQVHESKFDEKKASAPAAAPAPAPGYPYPYPYPYAPYPFSVFPTPYIGYNRGYPIYCASCKRPTG